MSSDKEYALNSYTLPTIFIRSNAKKWLDTTLGSSWLGGGGIRGEKICDAFTGKTAHPESNHHTFFPYTAVF